MYMCDVESNINRTGFAAVIFVTVPKDIKKDVRINFRMRV